MAEFPEEQIVDARVLSTSLLVILYVALVLFACTGTIATLTLLHR